MADRSLPNSPTRNEQFNSELTPAILRRTERKRRVARSQAENAVGRESVASTGALALSSVATLALFTVALLTLEVTNAATTYWALADFMGSAGVMGASFAALLALGLVALDTGGLFRLFGMAEPGRTFAVVCVGAAWLLAATTNAILTWWAVTAAMAEHVTGNALLSDAQLLEVTPIFLALALWLIRLMLVAGWAQGERGQA